jgi:hypothetical protein
MIEDAVLQLLESRSRARVQLELLPKVVDQVREKGDVPFRVGHAKPGGSWVEGDATDAEGSGECDWRGSGRAVF